MGAGRLAGLALAAAFLSTAAVAQTLPASPFLFINQERLLTGSTVGKALLADEERQRDELRSEARALDSAFEAEEQQLTEKRPTTKPEDFRALADAFDARVVAARRDQDTRATTMGQEFDQRRRQFYARVAPMLVELMDKAGARAVFDENSALLTDQTLNITDEVIARIDAAGTPPEDAAPETTAPGLAGPGAAPVTPAPDATTAPFALAPQETLPPDQSADEIRPVPRPEGAN